MSPRTAAEDPPPTPGPAPEAASQAPGGPRDGTKRPTTVERGPPAPVDPPRSAVVVVDHDDQSIGATLWVVGETEASRRGLAALPGPALPGQPWSHQVVAAADPQGRFVVAESAQMGGYKLRLSDGDGARFVAIGERRPTALMLHGDRIYIGAGHEVGWVDLQAARPTFVRAHARESLRGTGKSYDLLARDGDWLLAIDDIVMPIYGDSFAITGAGLAHEVGFELPGVVNGSYTQALLRRGVGPREGWLYTLTPYAILDGHGHGLAALPLRDRASVYGSGLTLNSSRHRTPPVLEEHVPRGGGEARLVAGADYTPFTGLARQGERALLIAAGARGLLSLPLDFTAESAAQASDRGGEVLDVLADDTRAWVLVRGEGGCRVERLLWTDPGWAVEATISCGAGCRRLLR